MRNLKNNRYFFYSNVPRGSQRYCFYWQNLFQSFPPFERFLNKCLGEPLGRGWVAFWSLAWLLQVFFITRSLRAEREPHKFCNWRSILAAPWLWDFGQATDLMAQFQDRTYRWVSDPAIVVQTSWIVEQEMSPTHKITLSAVTAISKPADKKFREMGCSCFYNEQGEKMENSK